MKQSSLEKSCKEALLIAKGQVKLVKHPKFSNTWIPETALNPTLLSKLANSK